MPINKATLHLKKKLFICLHTNNASPLSFSFNIFNRDSTYPIYSSGLPRDQNNFYKPLTGKSAIQRLLLSYFS